MKIDKLEDLVITIGDDPQGKLLVNGELVIVMSHVLRIWHGRFAVGFLYGVGTSLIAGILVFMG